VPLIGIPSHSPDPDGRSARIAAPASTKPDERGLYTHPSPFTSKNAPPPQPGWVLRLRACLLSSPAFGALGNPAVVHARRGAGHWS